MTNGVRGENRSMEGDMGILCELRLGERVRRDNDPAVYVVTALWTGDIGGEMGSAVARCEKLDDSGRRAVAFLAAPAAMLKSLDATPHGDDPPPCPI
jgi:hypothetical protein